MLLTEYLIMTEFLVSHWEEKKQKLSRLGFHDLSVDLRLFKVCLSVYEQIKEIPVV